MLGFILSKLNLLILVVAIFAIVAYFTIGLADVMKTMEAQLVAQRAASRVAALAESPSYCDSVPHYFPHSVRVAGEDMYYVLKISKATVKKDGGTLTKVIFSVFSRLEQGKAIAADSFDTAADVRLYGETDGVWGVEDYIAIDPQAAVPVDAAMFIKEKIGGKAILHIIPCNTNMCEANKTSVAQQVDSVKELHGSREVFNC